MPGEDGREGCLIIDSDLHMNEPAALQVLADHTGRKDTDAAALDRRDRVEWLANDRLHDHQVDVFPPHSPQQAPVRTVAR